MKKPEPVIIAPGYTDYEIYEWMHGKVRAINNLWQAVDYKKRLSEELASVEQHFATLKKNATLNISRAVVKTYHG
ncbi:hypothetical protein AOY57_12760 [Escherichia coli]|uniref:hypothetical protein n=1 Tax=Escherichia coli TaxID=562 RepID=UPI0019193B1E|nr:hypothetical protein [Escherichia coli]UMT23048.1 hypothetical protein AOY57_12760 [Escherichia coli]CAD6136933.1 putative prophage protein [Escherichia coli]